MTAIEIAASFESFAIDHEPDGWPAVRQKELSDAAAMLRKQAEAIKVLREALAASAVALNIGHNTITALEVSRQALKDTEEFK